MSYASEMPSGGEDAANFEGKRLHSLERLLDPLTIRRLARLGVKAGWRCLEVGAGEGSIARWLAQQVGSQGHVVATDINIRRLNDIREPNLELRRHNILADDLEQGAYDLVHSVLS